MDKQELIKRAIDLGFTQKFIGRQVLGSTFLIDITHPNEDLRYYLMLSEMLFWLASGISKETAQGTVQGLEFLIDSELKALETLKEQEV